MSIEKYWEQFVDGNPEYSSKPYTAWQFGADPDTLAQLVIDGTKTLTCSGLKLYEIEDEALPKVGDISIILNTSDEPVCVIENTSVYTIPFKDAGEEIAYKEGEGDRSLSYWRQAHLDFFIPEFKNQGLVFSEEEMIVVEEFKVI